jgi:hypothetical protein
MFFFRTLESARIPPINLRLPSDNSTGIFKQSMGAKNRVGIGLLYRPARLYRLAFFHDSFFSLTNTQSTGTRIFSFLYSRSSLAHILAVF